MTTLDYVIFLFKKISKNKYEVEELFMKYKAEDKNQLDKKIKRFRSNRGGEYGSNIRKRFCTLFFKPPDRIAYLKEK